MQGADPIAQLAQLRTQQPQPIGPNQGMGGLTMGAPVPNGPPHPNGPMMPTHDVNGAVQNVLNEFANASMQRGDQGALAQHLREIGKILPKLRLADHRDGHAELVGPAQDQFVAAAYARSHGAKVAHVRNDGRGQRLHLEF